MEAADEVGEDQYWVFTGEAEVPDDVTHVRVSDDVTVLRERAVFGRRRLVAVELNQGLPARGWERGIPFMLVTEICTNSIIRKDSWCMLSTNVTSSVTWSSRG